MKKVPDTAQVPVAIQLGDLREWLEAAAHEAVRLAIDDEIKLVRERFQDVLPQVVELDGEDVPDQGPSVATNKDCELFTAVTLASWAVPEAFRDRLKQFLESEECQAQFPEIESVRAVVLKVS